jgi:hypothetical protein
MDKLDCPSIAGSGTIYYRVFRPFKYSTNKLASKAMENKG